MVSVNIITKIIYFFPWHSKKVVSIYKGLMPHNFGLWQSDANKANLIISKAKVNKGTTLKKLNPQARDLILTPKVQSITCLFRY